MQITWLPRGNMRVRSDRQGNVTALKDLDHEVGIDDLSVRDVKVFLVVLSPRGSMRGDGPSWDTREPSSDTVKARLIPS